MRSIHRSLRSFQVRPRAGHVREPVASYSAGLFAWVGEMHVAVDDDAVIEAALKILARRVVRSSSLATTRLTKEYFALRFATLEHEVFTCLYLDQRHRAIACEDLFRGTINVSDVHPREVVKQALIHNAAAVIFAHNHPSGVPEPSQPDEMVTRRLKQALDLVDIRVLDHVVIGGADAVSFSERGLL